MNKYVYLTPAGAAVFHGNLFMFRTKRIPFYMYFNDTDKNIRKFDNWYNKNYAAVLGINLMRLLYFYTNKFENTHCVFNS